MGLGSLRRQSSVDGRHTHDSVYPVPIVQIVNTVVGLLGVMNEFSKPVNRFLSRHHLRFLHNIPFRCVIYIMALAPAVIQFQTSQATPYMLIGTAMYSWGYFEGERLNEEGIGYCASDTRLTHAISD
jgi:hypothetical protein